MEKIHFSKLWYIGRLKHIDGELQKLPDLRMGKHGDKTIFRYKMDGKHHEVWPQSKKWDKYKSAYDIRENLLAEYRILCREFEEYFGEEYENIRDRYKVTKMKTKFDTAYWNRLIDDECPADTTTEYVYDNHQFRSRFEMQEGIALHDLRMKYKYDSCVYVTDMPGYTDFAILLEEFGCAFLIELMGSMDDIDNIARNTRKFHSYAECGYLLGRDWFVLPADRNYMPNIDRAKMQIVGIVNAIAQICVVEVE